MIHYRSLFVLRVLCVIYCVMLDSVENQDMFKSVYSSDSSYV